MDEGEKPHLIPYRKDSTQIFFKVDKKNKFQPSNKSDLTPVSSKQRDSGYPFTHFTLITILLPFSYIIPIPLSILYY